jgi:hypothetical protein
MILVYGAIVWRKGFTAEDRAILGGRAARA